MKKGLFITFEGPDGSGKSTQIELLRQYLVSLGKDVVLAREPGGTQISEKLRDIILDKENSEMTPVTEMLLYAAARAQLVGQLIGPALREGKIVICDRFVDSSVAYQGFGRNLGDMVMQVNEPAIAGYMPDLTIYLRLDPQVGKSRIDSSSFDRLESEKINFHRLVSQGYDEICKREPGRVIPVDAALSIEEISSIIRSKVDEILK